MNPTHTNSADNSKNEELSIFEALIPVVALILMLFYNVFFVFGDNALNGSNQFILLLGAAVAAIVGFFKKISYNQMLNEVSENLKSTSGALLICRQSPQLVEVLHVRLCACGREAQVSWRGERPAWYPAQRMRSGHGQPRARRAVAALPPT